ncbi:MAG: hypothetical protein ACO2PM_14740 [Pyrobaculum sp.]
MPRTRAVTDVCRYVRRWINSLRRDMCIAISVDELLELMNGYLEAVGYGNLEKVTEADLKGCLKRSKTVEIVVKDGGEVLWLWGGRRRRELFDRIIKMTVKNGEVSVA